MKPTHTIEGVLGSRSRIAVLRELWGVGVPLNASQIAVRTRLTRPAVATVLRELGEAGVVSSSSAGRANVHLLNRANVYVQRYVDPLFSAEQDMGDHLLRDLRTAFEGVASSVVVFGSYARGEQDAGSDVDVVLVAEDATAKETLDHRAAEYAREFRARYGASLSALTYEESEANALWRTSPALVQSLRDEGVVVFGSGPWEWSDDEQG